MKPPSLTIGIEEEYQIIDPKTRELRSYITEILKEDSVLMGEVKPELRQSKVDQQDQDQGRDAPYQVRDHPGPKRQASAPREPGESQAEPDQEGKGEGGTREPERLDGAAQEER